jgi:hypothetical protein
VWRAHAARCRTTTHGSEQLLNLLFILAVPPGCQTWSFHLVLARPNCVEKLHVAHCPRVIMQPCAEQTQPCAEQTRLCAQLIQPCAEPTQPCAEPARPALRRANPAMCRTKPASLPGCGGLWFARCAGQCCRDLSLCAPGRGICARWGKASRRTGQTRQTVFSPTGGTKIMPNGPANAKPFTHRWGGRDALICARQRKPRADTAGHQPSLSAPRRGWQGRTKPPQGDGILYWHRSHFGSRYKTGCCGHAGLFALSLVRSLPAARKRH